LLCIFALAVPSGDAAGQSAPDRPIILIDIKGAIGFVTAGQLTKALERATAQGSPALIVRLDTPGGLLSSTREMIQTILAARVPVVMYVAPNGARAASAGTYLLYASPVAAMAPGTHPGAATLTASVALKERVIDVVAKDVEDLLAQIDGRSVTTAAGEVRLATKGRSLLEIKPDWKMQLMSAITDPNIALILLMIGVYGILFE